MSASASLEAVRPVPLSAPPGRMPPQNLDAERSVLGGVLLDNNAFNDILEVLKPEDFYRDAHRKVFEAMCALSSRGEPIDRVTLKDELTALGAYETVGGEDFIDLLDKLVPSAANLSYYATIVHEKANSSTTPSGASSPSLRRKRAPRSRTFAMSSRARSRPSSSSTNGRRRSPASRRGSPTSTV